MLLGFTLVNSQSLERLCETDHNWTLIYAGTINQVGCAIGAVDFVTLESFLVAFAAFLKLGAAITIS
jgi:hypothetical protein